MLSRQVQRCQDIGSNQGRWYVFTFAPLLPHTILNPYQVDPLFAFTFIHTFVEILQEYFGTLSAATLKDNFDVVYQAGLS